MLYNVRYKCSNNLRVSLYRVYSFHFLSAISLDLTSETKEQHRSSTTTVSPVQSEYEYKLEGTCDGRYTCISVKRFRVPVLLRIYECLKMGWVHLDEY